MKLNYRQKLYFYILVIFLIFFNGGIFSVAAIQNTKNIKAQQDFKEKRKENFLLFKL